MDKSKRGMSCLRIALIAVVSLFIASTISLAQGMNKGPEGMKGKMPPKMEQKMPPKMGGKMAPMNNHKIGGHKMGNGAWCKKNPVKCKEWKHREWCKKNPMKCKRSNYHKPGMKH